MPVFVDTEAADLGERNRRVGRDGAAKDGVHAEHELAHAEWFDDVIGRTELEADDAIHLFGFGGDEHHRDVARLWIALQFSADIGAREIRKHNVEEHEIRAAITHDFQAFSAARRDHDVMSGLAQTVIEDPLKSVFVLDDEDRRHSVVFIGLICQDDGRRVTARYVGH